MDAPRRLGIAFLLIGALFLAACGSPSAGGCDEIQTASRCRDFSGSAYTADDVAQACSQGSVIEECPLSQSVGQCEVFKDEEAQRHVYYPFGDQPHTNESGLALCNQLLGRWLSSD